MSNATIKLPKDRLSAYYQQNGQDRRITSRQRRRLHKKHRRQVRLESLIVRTSLPVIETAPPAETSGDFGPVPVPARPCGGVEYCITKSGNKAKTHVGCKEYEVAA